jgi:hypothetical protein
MPLWDRSRPGCSNLSNPIGQIRSQGSNGPLPRGYDTPESADQSRSIGLPAEVVRGSDHLPTPSASWHPSCRGQPGRNRSADQTPSIDT